MARRRILMLLQWSVSIALLLYVVRRIDFDNVIATATRASAPLLVAGIAPLLALPLVGGARWMFVIRALGARLSARQAVRFVWAGTFFSQTLPASVGGDAIRMWLLWRAGANRRIAVNSVIVERAMMMISLLLMIAALHPALRARLPEAMVDWLAIVIVSCLAGGAAFLMTFRLLPARIAAWMPLRLLGAVASDLRLLLSSPGAALLVAATCVVSYLSMAMSVWLIALALKMTVNPEDCIALVPLVILASTLPLSIGGWGVREGTMVVLMSNIGVPAASSLALSVLFGIAGILVSLPGLAVWPQSSHSARDLTDAAAMAERELQSEAPS